MNAIVRFNVNLTIHEGKLEEFQNLAQAMISATHKEPGALAYDWCFSRDGKRCRILETYADATAVQAHISGVAVQEFVPKMLGVSSINAFEVYGDPGPEAAKTLTKIGAEIFPFWRGLDR